MVTAFCDWSRWFIGSHLVELLIELGAEVRALVFYNSWNEIGWLKDIPEQVLKQIEIVTGDVRMPTTCVNWLRGATMSYLSSLVVHVAIMRRSLMWRQYNWRFEYSAGMQGLDSLTRLVNVSASETYGTAQYVPIDETHPMVGQSHTPPTR